MYWNLCPHKNLHMDFYRSLFIIAKTWKQTSCFSVGEWINKLWYIHTMEYYSALKRNELSSREKKWRKLKNHIAKWKMPIWKGYILYDSNYMTFWKRQNYGVSKKISGCQALGESDGWRDGAQRIFRAVKLSCVTQRWWIHVIIHLSKQHQEWTLM